VWLRQLWLTDFRSYPTADVELPEGLTAVLGSNGQGKSNLLEAIGYLIMLRSFRGAAGDTMVRVGADRAFVRGELSTLERPHLIEVELSRTGRNRVLVDRQRLVRHRDLVTIARCTVFAPDDLELVKGGPALRRGFLDDLLVLLHPRHDVVRSDWERSLKQRNALLKQVHGRPDDSALVTLDVWDQKLATAGEELVRIRRELTDRIAPAVVEAYRDVAGEEVELGLRYVSPWRRPEDGDRSLADVLAASRSEELRRGLSLYGPHRDELQIDLRGLPARTHASQGEQRSLALELRLASHRVLTEIDGSPPLLLLDDVFSELDADRSAALLRSLPVGQTLLSAAVNLPDGVVADLVLDVGPGSVRPRQ